MTQQKSVKRRVRARMAKTGERYTAARHQLLARAAAPAPAPTPDRLPEPAASDTPPLEVALLATKPEAMLRATGRSYESWFALLDDWGGTAHTHTEIAAWLTAEHDAPGWWVQAITVSYERARGMRKVNQMTHGFAVSATKTVALPADRALAAFTDAAIRERWLPGAKVGQRPSRATLVARFDWADPTSRIMVSVAPKGPARSAVTVSHERLPDPETATRIKLFWRARLKDLPLD